jgi:hypothetical protein
MLAGDTLDHSDIGYGQRLGRSIRFEIARSVHGRLVRADSPLKSNSEHMGTELDLLTDLTRVSRDTCALDGDPDRWLSMTHEIMVATLPYLNEKQGIEIIDAIAASDCTVTQESRSMMWLDVYRAVARRDASMMSAAARRLLASEAEIPRVRQVYLVSAVMLGDVVADELEGALEIWNRYSDEAFADGDLPSYMHLITAAALHSIAGDTQHANAGKP